MSTTDTTALRLSEVLAGLSVALDLTEGQPLGHAGRSCIAGMRLAGALDLDADQRSALYYALLLKDAGCSSNAAHVASLFGGDDRIIKHERTLVDRSSKLAFAAYVARNVRPGAGPLTRARGIVHVARFARTSLREIALQRCERGAEVARMLDLPEATAAAIRALDERWDGSGFPDGLAGEQIPLLARVLAVAQTAEVFAGAGGPSAAAAALRSRRGTFLDPALVDVLAPLAERPAFWEDVRGEGWRERVAALEPADRVVRTDDDGLDRVADAFAGIVDAKSPFTRGHSARVAAITDALAPRVTPAPEDRRALRRAALLHDLGKLGVPNTILDTPGPLSARQWAVVKRHPAHTEQILRRVPPLQRIASMAAAHHERLDGSGYHRALRGDELGSGARLIAVADVYEALTSPRPYQGPVEPERALAVIAAQAPHALWTQGHRALAEALAEGRPELAPPEGRQTGVAGG
ncbi:MAG: HD-GYP domain-containing protein [Solirubrobacteraceae bacterium]